MTDIIHDATSCKLGRKAVKTDTRTLKLATYITPSLPAPPTTMDWSKDQKSFGMMLNDRLGCCTIAGCGHSVQIWSLNSTGVEITVPDSAILSYYEQWDGYIPNDPSSDRGGIELDVLNKWRKDGFFGHQLLAYAAVNPRNLTEVQQAIALFGGIYIGVALPITAQYQQIWDVNNSNPQNAIPGSWGGHCVTAIGYDKDYITIITWGALKKVTWAFWINYVDEAYALIGQDFFNAKGLDPRGFGKEALMEDLSHIR